MPVSTLRLAVLSLCLLLAGQYRSDAHGQAFQNLNFEQTVFAPQWGAGYVTVPAWRFSDELPILPPLDSPPGTPLGTTNVLGIGAHIGIEPLQRISTDLVPPQLGPLPLPIEGHFTVVMRAALFDFNPGTFPWMEQTGLIPLSTQSIRLLSTNTWGSLANNAGWILTMNNVEIPMVTLPDGRSSGDISSLAGTVQTMRIAMNRAYGIQIPPGPPQRVAYTFDAFRFSPLPFNQTPEPASAKLLLMTLATWMCRRVRRT